LVLIADVSEPTICSIFMGRWMKNDWDGTCGANGRESDRTMWVESQQVVEGGGIYKCECGYPALALMYASPFHNLL
jgi:hypothetical protein